MFTIYYLLISFAILGLMDIIGKNRIDLRYLAVFSAASILLSAIFGYYSAVLNGYYLYAAIASAVLLYALPKLGIGDKIFLSSLLLLYPFWFVWVLIALAVLLAKPVFMLMARFSRSKRLEAPFYPFLFISSAILLIALNAVYYLS